MNNMSLRLIAGKFRLKYKLHLRIKLCILVKDMYKENHINLHMKVNLEVKTHDTIVCRMETGDVTRPR